MMTIVLPLSLIFGWIIMLINLIKSNELVGLYSLGHRRKRVVLPVLSVALFFIIGLITLQSTSLAYSYEQKERILDNEYFSNIKENIFLKYNNYFIYFNKLYPVQKIAQDIQIFKVNGNDISETITADTAYYRDQKWYLVDATVMKKPSKILWNESKIDIEKKNSLYILEGFKPKILDNVYSKEAYYSIIDAFYTISLLNKQNFNTDKIRTILYSQTIALFFVLPAMIIIFLLSNPSSRFFNIRKFTSFSIFATLTLWGVMFLLTRLASGNVVTPEVAIILPILLLYVISYYIYTKRDSVG
jgi:lipopolysaccharide export system permease protein